MIGESERNLILEYLDKITDLRKANERVSNILEREDIISDVLAQETENVVGELLNNYAPDTIRNLLSAIREGKLPIEDHADVRNRLLEGV